MVSVGQVVIPSIYEGAFVNKLNYEIRVIIF